MFRAKFGRWHWVAESNLAAHLRAPPDGVASLDPHEETARMWRQCVAIKSSALRKIGSATSALSFSGGDAGEGGHGGQTEQAEQAGRGAEEGAEEGGQAAEGHSTRERSPRETPGGACGFVSPSGTTTCVGGDGAEVAAGFLSPPNATTDAESEAERDAVAAAAARDTEQVAGRADPPNPNPNL